jgi:amphi-Trp domain-containing protein
VGAGAIAQRALSRIASGATVRSMSERDVEVIKSRTKFVTTLRRVADAIERGKPVRMQVAGKRILVPTIAALSVEHEVSGAVEELELQLRWRNDPPAKPSGRS